VPGAADSLATFESLKCAAEAKMNFFHALARFKTFILVSMLVAVIGVAGIAVTLKATVSYLLYWDSTAAAESWARYVVENVDDIEDIAAGKQPSADSMTFFIRTQQIRNVFGFEIADLDGNVRLVSDGAKITTIRGDVHDEMAARTGKSGQPVVDVKEGVPPLRPLHYSEAYLPVAVAGRPRAVVAAYVDLTDQYNHFRSAFLLAAVALCLLTGAGVSIPTIAWHRRTKEKERAERRIDFLARHDALTGLANRAQFIERMELVFATLSLRDSGIAVHFIDLDRFKGVNDGFGHDGGDFLLKTVAERLSAVIRAADEVARFGGDEFIALQSNVKDRSDAEAFALRLAAALNKPMWFKEQEINVTVSIGYALAPADADHFERLLKCADLAVYRAKADGRNCVRGFLPSMDETLMERIKLEKAIRHAMKHDGFALHYQPMFGIGKRDLIGFEALIRMRAEDGTLVPPLAFIPLAEELRLIGKIGEWVIREACKTAATWPAHLTVAVNVSVAQFEAGGMSEIVAAALKDAGLEAKRLELEITESLLLDDKKSVMEELWKLKTIGVGIVMDDFGTGYSSLSYLWRYPFSKIKIDQSFMSGLDRSGQDAETIVKTIVALGRELHMRVTVEGVETPEQASFLSDIKGDQAQGFFFGRPVPSSEVAAVVLSDFQRAQKGTNTEAGKAAYKVIRGRVP
jgi:diguanylate cyclase (GGDEF)-like protein